jgi:hypothetical protein
MTPDQCVPVVNTPPGPACSDVGAVTHARRGHGTPGSRIASGCFPPGGPPDLDMARTPTDLKLASGRSSLRPALTVDASQRRSGRRGPACGTVSPSWVRRHITPKLVLAIGRCGGNGDVQA